jgi:hypothetical protein
MEVNGAVDINMAPLQPLLEPRLNIVLRAGRWCATGPIGRHGNEERFRLGL